MAMRGAAGTGECAFLDEADAGGGATGAALALREQVEQGESELATLREVLRQSQETCVRAQAEMLEVEAQAQVAAKEAQESAQAASEIKHLQRELAAANAQLAQKQRSRLELQRHGTPSAQQLQQRLHRRNQEINQLTMEREGLMLNLRQVMEDRAALQARAELLAGEREADEARRREAGGAGAGAGANASLLPLLRLGGLEAPCLPHCTAEVELRTDLERGLVEYALRGARRLGVIDGSDAFDDDARPLGVCLEIQDIERPPHQLQQPVRVRLVGKFRFWLVEPPEVHEEGFELGRVEAFFDEALSPADLALSRGEAEPPDADGVEQPLPTPEVARAALELLEHQLVQVGHAGRRVFGGKFGEVPVLRTDGATTSASMERLSFWLLGVILVDLSERRQWLACVDTRARLESCRERLAAAGTRPVLDLPGARSWMNPGQSAFSSFALLLAIVAVLVAKAMGLFERGFRGYMNDEGLQDTVMFGQLLR